MVGCWLFVAGKWRSQVDVAVKTLKQGQMSADAFLEEAKIMHRLRHRKLVQLMGVCTTDPDNLLIVTELMCNGSLKDYLKNQNRKTMPLRRLVDVIVHVS